MHQNKMLAVVAVVVGVVGSVAIVSNMSISPNECITVTFFGDSGVERCKEGNSNLNAQQTSDFNDIIVDMTQLEIQKLEIEKQNVIQSGDDNSELLPLIEANIRNAEIKQEEYLEALPYLELSDYDFFKKNSEQIEFKIEQLSENTATVRGDNSIAMVIGDNSTVNIQSNQKKLDDIDRKVDLIYNKLGIVPEDPESLNVGIPSDILLELNSLKNERDDLKLQLSQMGENIPIDLNLLKQESIVYYHTGQFQKLLENADTMLESEPNNVLALNYKGLALANLDMDDVAIIYYLRALEIDRSYHVVWNNLGVSQDAVGRYDQAIKSYNVALELNPKYTVAQNNLGLTFEHLGEYEKAVTEFNKILEVNPNDLDALLNSAFSLGYLGMYDESIDRYHKSIKLDPNDALTRYNLAYDLGEVGRYDEAIKSYEKALEIDPNYVSAWHNLGVMYLDLGKYHEAITSFENALEIEPNNPDRQNNLDMAKNALEESR